MSKSLFEQSYEVKPTQEQIKAQVMLNIERERVLYWENKKAEQAAKAKKSIINKILNMFKK